MFARLAGDCQSTFGAGKDGVSDNRVTGMDRATVAYLENTRGAAVLGPEGSCRAPEDHRRRIFRRSRARWAGAYAALPGPHRALTPGLFGLSQAAPGLWIDDPAQGPGAEELIHEANAVVADFFGPLETRPFFVFCTTQACADRFGLRPNGLTYGHRLIVIGPKGQNPTIVTHERAHAEVHRSLRLSDLWHQRIPTWFDEGLATHLSGSTRVDRPADPRDADWICAARSFRDWGRVHTDRGWRSTYGAAARLVDEIEAAHGRAALRALVEAVEAGADFDTEYARLMPGATACAAPPS